MMLGNTIVPVLAALVLVPAAMAPASAQLQGTQEQQTADLHAATGLRTRLAMTDARIVMAWRTGKVTRRRIATLHRRIARTRAGLARLSRQHGFVSVGELASWHRTLAAINGELDRLGVASGDGNGAPYASPTVEGLQYACANEPVAIAIPGDRLDVSLNALRLTIRCPISETALARGKRSRPVVGTMTPSAALQAMLGGTGLEGRAIKGGFQIVRPPR